MRPTKKSQRTRISREDDLRRIEDAAQFYLRACFGTRTPVRPREFAAYLRLARPYLSRRVTELLGVQLRDFLRERQLAEAKRLLTNTPITVQQVALASGFASEWTFHRCFKAAFGITPARYRARRRVQVTE